MKSSGLFEVRVHDVTFDVDYDVSGYGDDCEIESLEIFIHDVEMSQVLSDAVLKVIEEKVMERVWNDGPDCQDDPREDR